ncbi:MAG: hypothetical protein AAF604_04665 [Acidobacteriota bacterium]
MAAITAARRARRARKSKIFSIAFNNLWSSRILSNMGLLDHLPLPKDLRVALHRDLAIRALLERFRDGRPWHRPTDEEIARFRAGEVSEAERLDLIQRAQMIEDYDECLAMLRRLEGGWSEC